MSCHCPVSIYTFFYRFPFSASSGSSTRCVLESTSSSAFPLSRSEGTWPLLSEFALSLHPWPPGLIFNFDISRSFRSLFFFSLSFCQLTLPGSGFVHQEKNWGAAFPDAWMWAEGIAPPSPSGAPTTCVLSVCLFVCFDSPLLLCPSPLLVCLSHFFFISSTHRGYQLLGCALSLIRLFVIGGEKADG